MIPPGVFPGLVGAAVGLIRSPLWQSQGAISASGADYDAPCARDYQRSSMLERRRPVLQAWADFATGKTSDNVVPIRAARP